MTSTARSPRTSAERLAERDRTVGVLVVDDSLIFRTGMARAVKACDGLELLGEADCGEAALEAIARLEPDLVILDLRMPDIDGIGVLGALRAQDPPPKSGCWSSAPRSTTGTASRSRSSPRAPTPASARRSPARTSAAPRSVSLHSNSPLRLTAQ